MAKDSMAPSKKPPEPSGGKFKPPEKEPTSSEAPKPKSYKDEKMDAVRRAMGESQYEMKGAPELGSAEPMSDLPTGKFGAEGDDWTYEVGEDGSVIASFGGKSIPVKEGTDAYEAIVEQLKSGQLSSIESEDVTEEV